MLQAFYEYLMILDHLFSVKRAFAEQRKSAKQKTRLSNGGKNTCKWYNQQVVKIQHMQTVHPPFSLHQILRLMDRGSTVSHPQGDPVPEGKENWHLPGCCNLLQGGSDHESRPSLGSLFWVSSPGRYSRAQSRGDMSLVTVWDIRFCSSKFRCSSVLTEASSMAKRRKVKSLDGEELKAPLPRQGCSASSNS